MDTFSILIVDDEANIRSGLKALLQHKGYAVETAADGLAGLELFKETHHALVLSDIMMPNMTGIELAKQIKLANPETTVVLFTGYASIESAVDAFKGGADEYLLKPVNNDELLKMVARAHERAELKKSNEMLRQEMLRGEDLKIIGDSSGIRKVKDEIKQATDADIPVLIAGEVGTGKELVARSIHDQGSRKNQPFVAFSCSGIPANLQENELFGHEKEAVSGAKTQKYGLLEVAHKGTVLLAEVDEMPPELQAKLLRTLESGQFRRLGGSHDLSSDFRIISSSNQDLLSLVEEGKFREDLFYKLSSFKIDVPSLKERKTDIPLLVDYFCERKGRLDPVFKNETEFIKALQDYDWPGNVREFESVMERVFLLAGDDPIVLDHLPPEITDESLQFSGGYRGDIDRPTLAKIERDYIAKTLRELGGNKTHAAKALGISLKSLYNKLEKGGISHL